MYDMQSEKETLLVNNGCCESMLTEAQRGDIDRWVQRKFLCKGEFLVREGQAMQVCFHVLKGCIRQFQIVNGVEKTVQFYTEDQSITYLSQSNGQPSKYYLECLEDCELTAMDRTAELRLYKKYPEIESLARLAMEEQLVIFQERLANYISATPEQRYLDLMRERPELLSRVPQYHLASYLGIVPETLSRIRRRVVKGM
ncbi:MAG: Crp/Fnr family transcriptional regulator [Flavobacteriaceae bacterium]